MQITSLDYSMYTGRIAIGRLFRGEIHQTRIMRFVLLRGVKKVKLKSYLFSLD